MSGALDQKMEDAMRMIAQVSRLLRQGISNALPVAGDQYLTISIPGTLVDTRDITDGGSYVWTPQKSHDPFTPTAVKQAEAKLVDQMMPIATVLLGNTGRSVARSYARALDLLLPKIAAGSPGKESKPSDPRWHKAMEYLRTPDQTGSSPIAAYIDKQTAWQQAQTEWDRAKKDAHDAIVAKYAGTSGGDPSNTDLSKIQEEMNSWNQVNFRKYKTNVQGKWMDWVVNGNKYEVENSFGIVDIDSIMARIEQSKESFRNMTIVDDDGANEIQTVNLTPKNWAQLCQDKLRNWRADNGQFSYEQLVAEINRLTELRISLSALKDSKAEFPVDSSAKDVDLTKAEGDLQTKYEELYAAQGALNTAITNKKDDVKAEQGRVASAQTALKNAQDAYRDQVNSHEKHKVQTFGGAAGVADSWIDNQIKQVTDSIKRLTDIRDSDKFKGKSGLPVIAGVSDEDSKGGAAPAADPAAGSNPPPYEKLGTDIATPGDINERPVFTPKPAEDTTKPSVNGGALDPWTSIMVSYSASSFEQTKTSSSWGMSVSGGVSFGLFSLGGAYSHEESKQDMYQDMSKCDVTIAFQAMVVNIERPWLYGELFGDFELDCADDINLAPGPLQLQNWLKDVAAHADDIAKWTQFPSYPTSFIVAANTSIEFVGSTSHIEKHFSQHSNSGSMSVGYGPFSMSGSFHEAAQSSNVRMEVTATGCKILFGAPQIIGWTSQIIPRLPRDKKFDPLVTGFV